MDHPANAPPGKSPAPDSQSAAPKQPAPDPLIHRLIADRYRVLSLVACGGMGKVYRAEQLPLGRQVALKVLSDSSPAGERDPAFHRRFFLEASTVAKLSHPNTITVFDYGQAGDIYYIAMELLEGRTLQQALRDEGPFSEERTCHIARQLCRSLREAHSHGVIHRDLKSANVFLCEHGDQKDAVKVLDFGLVKSLTDEPADELTKAGLFLGSPKYMAPEQIRGDRVDVRTDIYALGVLLFEMLAGRVPFERTSSVHILMAHIHDQVPSLEAASGGLSFSPALSAVVRRCLEKEPRARFATMQDLLDAIKACSAGSGDTSDLTLPPAAGRAGYALATSSCWELQQPLGGVGMACADAARATLQSTPPSGLSARTGRLGHWMSSSQERSLDSFGFSSRPLIGRWAGALAIAALLSAGGVLAAAATGGAFNRRVTGDAFAGRPGAGMQQLAPDATAIAQPEPVSPPAAALAERSMQLHLRSTPAGATVHVLGKSYGPTPVSVELPILPEDRGQEITLVFARPGYRELAVTRLLRGDELVVDAPPLQRLPVRAPHAASPALHAERSGEAPALQRDDTLPRSAELTSPNPEGVAAGLGFMPSPY